MQQHTKLCEHDDHSYGLRTPGGLLDQHDELCSPDSLNQEGSGPGDISHSETNERPCTENVEESSLGK